MTTVKLLVDGKHLLGEGVLWCERSGRLLWTDILASRLWCHTLANGETQSWAMPEMLATFALTLDDDRLLLGLASQLAWFHFSSGKVTPIVAVESDLLTTRINDGRCDRQGRFVFGTKSDASDRAPNCSFYRLNTDLTLERLPLSPVVISNSICFSPDSATMYYCDTISNTIRCCDYESLDKTVPVQAFNNDRLFADLHDQPGSPDGSTIDSQGCLWNAQWGGYRVVRFTPDGQIDRIIAIPVSQPSCVAFGGPGLSTLFVTTAREDLSEQTLQSEPQAGGVFNISLEDVRGLPEGRFKGGAVLSGLELDLYKPT
ncbi:SMP-30/gluconolactonase/LRE family protein [Glaciimonas sp. Gout2]|uniref:SMP-30/gluconolactonase/LRE family protein n=2 Tax=Glaciimonas TaxID=1229970 RepID=UPI002B22524D|nr:MULTISPECIES: SMP-30/gluconolactonase/LRE family protein [unclassified Glaciimonas]MEB0011091.1 SMP-30/gluconolactonase/LRE family protein [Glaciimonas sp. Cout2]MEB0081231.1 SMP-30/gluconolactonase/LRE family protein [Glaciimonas sp. Gout2]